MQEIKTKFAWADMQPEEILEITKKIKEKLEDFKKEIILRLSILKTTTTYGTTKIRGSEKTK